MRSGEGMTILPSAFDEVQGLASELVTVLVAQSIDRTVLNVLFSPKLGARSG